MVENQSAVIEAPAAPEVAKSHLTGVASVIQEKFKRIHPLISDCNELLIFKYPYYAEILFQTTFWETEQVPTCGVNVGFNGFNFYYNKKFIESFPPADAKAIMMFIIIHEIFHLLFDHVKRTRGYDHVMSNIAQDMIINTIINRSICGKEKDSFIKIPYEVTPQGNRNSALFVPKEYKGELIFEELYAWLKDKQDEMKKNQKNQQQKPQKGQGGDKSEQQQGGGQGESQESQDGEGESEGEGQGQPSDKQGKGKGKPGEEKKDGKGDGKGQGKNQPDGYGPHGADDVGQYPLDKILKDGEENGGQSLDVHLGDDVPEELKKQIVDDVINGIRARGLNSGDFEDVVKKLRQSKKNYLKEIKRGLGEIIGDEKNGTWSRENRMGLPKKGYNRRTTCINVLLDTSGSMHGYFEKAISYIFHNDVTMNLIQCDTKAYDLGMIKNRKQLEKMKIHGLGGTCLQPAIDLIAKDYNKFATLILTDGGTENLDLSKLSKKVLILSVDQACPIAKHNGKLKQIVVDKDSAI
jgi:predicted metal-dependent peptidase